MTTRIETALATAIARAEAGAPPTLASALRFAVFSGGARVRHEREDLLEDHELLVERDLVVDRVKKNQK